VGEMARPASAEDHARLDLAVWHRIAATLLDLDPFLAFAGEFLWARAPASVSRTVLVQGDTGPGNFLCLDGRVTGLVDMEFAHIGDPMDDVAWVRMRAGEASERVLSAYSAAGGAPIDWASVRFYDAAVRYRCAVTTSLAVARGGGARG